MTTLALFLKDTLAIVVIRQVKPRLSKVNNNKLVKGTDIAYECQLDSAHINFSFLGLINPL